VPADVSVGYMQGFVAAALAGAMIALLAPVTFVQVLGAVAVAASVLGILLHGWLLRHDHPEAWDAWWTSTRSRIDGARAGWHAKLGPLPAGQATVREA
jgi:hypothetical protein